MSYLRNASEIFCGRSHAAQSCSGTDYASASTVWIGTMAGPISILSPMRRLFRETGWYFSDCHAGTQNQSQSDSTIASHAVECVFSWIQVSAGPSVGGECRGRHGGGGGVRGGFARRKSATLSKGATRAYGKVSKRPEDCQRVCFFPA